MTGLPNGWIAARLEEVAGWSSGGTPKAGTSEYYGGPVPWAIIGDLNDGRMSTTASTITEAGLANSSAKVVGPGTVLVAMYGSIGKLGIADVAMATNQAIACAVPNELVTREWLFWWLRFQRHEPLAAGKGGTQANISQTVLKAWPIPLAPRSEQERIVAAIEEAFSKLDAGEAGLRTVRQLLKRMRDAVLAAAATGRLVPQDPTDTPAAKLLADLGVDAIDLDEPPVPHGWAWATIESISAPQRNALAIGPFGSNLKVADYASDGVPLVFVRNIRRRDFRSDRKFVSMSKADELASHSVRRGDVLVTKMGDPPGDTAVYEEQDAAIITADCIKVTCGSAVAPEYLALAIAGGETRRRLLGVTRGVAQKKVSLARFKVLPVAIPPIQEQQRIVTEVDRQFSFLDACERAVDAGLARSAALRRSVLKAAFEGKVVPQEPNDEPASVLLERIRAERSAVPKTKTRRGSRQASRRGGGMRQIMPVGPLEYPRVHG